MNDKIEKTAWEELEGELQDAVRFVVEENIPQPFQHPVPRIRRNRKETNLRWSGRGVVLVVAVSLCLAVVAISLSNTFFPNEVYWVGSGEEKIEPQNNLPSYWNYRSAFAESPEAFERMLDRHTQSMNNQTKTLCAFSLGRIKQIPERKM